MNRRVNFSVSLSSIALALVLQYVASFESATEYEYYDPLSLSTEQPPTDYDDEMTKFLVDNGLYKAGCDKYCPGKCTVRPQSSEIICVCGRGKGINYIRYPPTCNACNCGYGGISCSFDIRGSKQCYCEAGYENKSGKCVKRKRPCESKPCRNGGICWEKNDHTSYMCTCPQNHTGKNCERGLNACNSNPCKNGGVCWYGSRFRYLCVCQKNHSGNHCERDVHVCDSKPCFNGDTCYRGNGTDYYCSCRETHTGKNCETAINPCDPKPCKNGGTCWRGEDINYLCTCVSDYGGKNCDSKNSALASAVTSTPFLSGKRHP